MRISYSDLTHISYIETILGIQYKGHSITDVANFIQENLLKARKAEPTYHEYLYFINARNLLG